MSYVLESENEFERLERQSRLPQYDHRKELEGIVIQAGQSVLDAGCGSGVIARYLAERQPEARIVACDLSGHRLASAERVSTHLRNLEYRCEDLREMSFGDAAFDLIVCRYVLQHVPHGERRRVASELLRCLKPGGQMVLIDMDGLYLNLHPRTQTVEEILRKLERFEGVDFRAAGSLPSLLAEAGFRDVDWRIETLEIKGHLVPGEIEMIRSRFDQTRNALVSVAGSAEKAARFEAEYLEALRKPGAVLFYNKFIVTARGQAKILPLVGRPR